MNEPGRRCHSDNGQSSLELALLFGVLLVMLVVLPWQGLLYWHGVQAVEFAAEQGVDAAKRYDANGGDAQAAVDTVLSQDGLVTGWQTTVTSGPSGDTVTVDVTGTAYKWGPWSLSVHGHKSAPVERFVPRAER